MAIYTALFLVVLLSVGAVVVDIASLSRMSTIAQRSADASALAGAWQLAHFQGKSYADVQARYYASLPVNGAYSDGVNKADVDIEYPAKDEDGVFRNNWYRVKLRRPEKTFFGNIFGRSSAVVTASATAIYTTLAPISIKGLGTYGTAPGPVNLSLFGPYGKYSNGDCYSTMYLDNGSKNPDYNPKGYDFLINVPDNFTNTTFEIYDPDCYNPNGPDSGNGQVDEYRTSSGGTGSVANATTTQFTLYADNGTPNNPNDDTLITTKSWGADPLADDEWVNFFTGSRRNYPGQNFRLNVVSTAGSSENGFDLRVGPRRTSSQSFNPNNGTTIAADGHLPMNFNQSGTVKIALGTLPVEAAGGTVDIRKFDTDVGAKSITYSCSSLPGKTWPGTLSSNGTFATDTLNVPTNYTTAGIWYAEYQAGTGDTSVWDMSYSNSGPGRPGTIKLIR